MVSHKKYFSKKYFLIFVKIFMVLCILTYAFITFLPNAKAEVYSSLVSMEQLITTQEYVIKSVKSHIPKVNVTKRGIVKRFVARCQREHDLAIVDVQQYLKNPINAFTLIKRLTRDLDYVEKILKESPYYLRNNKLTYPKETDMYRALRSIIHLQVIYDLNVTDLANGTLIGTFSKYKQKYIEFVTPMTSSDCYELALAAHDYGEYDVSIIWMIEAYKKFAECQNDCPFTNWDIVEFISRTYYLRGDFSNSLLWLEKKWSPDLDDQRKTEHTKFREHVEALNRSKLQSVEKNASAIKMKKNLENLDQLCLEETSRTVNNKSLSCFYTCGPHPFLHLARLKTEQLHLRPDVTMYHDVVSDGEIQFLKRIARPRLEDAAIFQGIKNPNLRVTQVAWLRDRSSKVLEAISRLVSHITGMTEAVREDLQVANYGIGGFYDPHMDVDMEQLNKTQKVGLKGYRRCTVLFYLSEVEQGGATVFLSLELTVFPVKRAAIFWRNLRPSGRADTSMLHAACPVLRGSKWMATKWFSDATVNPTYFGEKYKNTNFANQRFA